MNIEVIKEGLAFLEAAYPGRFQTSTVIANLWLKMLGDIKASAYEAAIHQLIMTKKDYPPCIAEVRETAINLQFGDVMVLSAEQAWMTVLTVRNERREIRKARDMGQPVPAPMFSLTGIAQKALDNIGGWWQLANSANPGMDRAAFIKAYNQFAEAQRIDRVTSPRVSAYADNHTPLLEAPVVVDVPVEKEPDLPSPEELAGFLKQLSTIGEMK